MAEDHDKQGSDEVGSQADLRSGDGFEYEEDPEERDEEDGASDDYGPGEVVFGAWDFGGRGAGFSFVFADGFDAFGEGGEDGGGGAEEGD